MAARTKAKDRRKFARYPADLIVAVTRPAASALGLRSGDFEARLIDVSRNGVQFLCDELFYRHEKLTVAIYGRDNLVKLRVEVEVVRSKRVPRRYQTAARMLKALPLDEPFGEDGD
jgi:hypothetical protein